MQFKQLGSGAWSEIPYYVKTTATDTLLTLPATIYTDGTNAAIDIKGNTVQSGTPTSSSPVDIDGTGIKTPNLFDTSTIEKGRIDSGVVDYASGTTSFTVSNNEIAFTINTNYRGICGDFIEIPSGTARIAMIGEFSGTNGINKKFVFYDAQKTWLDADVTIATTKSSGTVTVPNNAKYVRVSLVGQTASNTYQITNFMLNFGTESLPYEPYGYKVLVTCGNTTTSVYFGNVSSTRNIKKLVLTGQETSWHTSSGFFYNDDIQPDYKRTTARIVYCTHYQGIASVTGGADVGDGECSFYSPVGVQRLYIRDSNYTTTSAFQAYLANQYSAGTPVTLWYVLATPEIGIVNEPLMKIDNYVDSIGDISVSTTAGVNSLSVDATVQPSELTVTYNGWHTGIVHERENGSWTLY